MEKPLAKMAIQFRSRSPDRLIRNSTLPGVLLVVSHCDRPLLWRTGISGVETHNSRPEQGPSTHVAPRSFVQWTDNRSDE